MSASPWKSYTFSAAVAVEDRLLRGEYNTYTSLGRPATGKLAANTACLPPKTLQVGRRHQNVTLAAPHHRPRGPSGPRQSSRGQAGDTCATKTMPATGLQPVGTWRNGCPAAAEGPEGDARRVYRPTGPARGAPGTLFGGRGRPQCSRQLTSPGRLIPELRGFRAGSGHSRCARTLLTQVPSPALLLLVSTAPILLTELAIYLVFFFFCFFSFLWLFSGLPASRLPASPAARPPCPPAPVSSGLFL